MADEKITLEVVTPRGLALREIVDDVAAPSVQGEFGILPGHLPIVAALRTGIVTYHKNGEEKRLCIANGFVEVTEEKALILTDKVLTRDQIDPVPVRLELKEAEQKLLDYAGEPNSPEWQELIASELWAAAQLELYGDAPHATHRPYEASTAPEAPVQSQPAPDETGSTSPTVH